MLTAEQITSTLKNRAVDNDNAFEILQSICALANRAQISGQGQVQDLVLRALDQRDAFNGYEDMLNGLTRHFGLYPYLNPAALGIKDALVRELHRPSVLATSADAFPNEDLFDEDENSEKGIVFHRVQAEVFRLLLAGKNVVLSAPTSFGKSSLIDALIETGRFANVVIVVPTIALIDETRRRLVRFKKSHKIITHASQALADHNIFVLTQERTVDFPDMPEIDLFVLDEFYKLDPREDSDRAMTLNHAFYKMTKKAKQFYMLGPNIQRIPEGFPERFKCQFIRTDFNTVVTELVRVKSTREGELDDLLKLCRGLKDRTLIFCASPARARRVTELLADQLPRRRGYGMPDAAKWAADNYHPDWVFVKGLKNGIGMHHGRMPRALSQMCVKGFNDDELNLLVCTSTLIEGVNTKAKNVVVFDNKIAKQKYDYFTFNNIRGRSGRMGRHFIGNVFIFHDPPQADLPFVDIPVMSQYEENTSLSLLVQMDDKDLEPTSHERLKKYKQQQLLSWEVLRQNTGIEPEDQIALAKHLAGNTQALHSLAWTGVADWEKLKALCEMIWDFFIKSKIRIGGVSSGPQLAFRISQLRNKTIRDLIQWELEDKKDKKDNTADDAVESTLEFIRQWPQFRFPRLAMGICRIQREVCDLQRRQELKSDYRFYVGQVESLFSDPALIALDEYGLPFPLAKKLESRLGGGGSLDSALRRLSTLRPEQFGLTKFEQQIVLDVKQSI